MLHTRSLLALSLLLVTACTTSEPVVANVRLRVGLPQNAAAYDWIQVTATQGGVSVDGVVGDDLAVTFTLQVGIEATLAAALLEHDASGVFAYEGSTTLTPEPTTTDVIVETALVEVQTGSILPTFSDGTEFLPDVELTITDGASGVTFPALFRSRVSLSLPLGRSVTFEGQNPVTGELFIATLDADVPFGDRLPVVVGNPPIAPMGNPNKPVGFFAIEDLSYDERYTLSCALGSECPGTDLTWGDCEAITAPLASIGVDDAYAVLVHYDEAPTECAPLLFIVDATAPLLKISFDPSHLAPGDAEVTTATIESDDYLDPTSLSVTELGGDGTELCGSPVGDTGFWRCELSLAAGSGVRSFTVHAADLSGNATTIESNLVDLHDQTPADVQITDFRIAGWGATTGDTTLTFVVTVQSFSSTTSDVFLDGAMLEDVNDPGMSLANFNGVNDIATHERELNQGYPRELWGVMEVSEPGMLDPTSSFILTPSLSVMGDTSYYVTQSFRLRIAELPFHWVAPSLAISSLVGSAPGFRGFTVPLSGGGVFPYPDLRSDDLDILVASGNELRPIAVGEALVTTFLEAPAVTRSAHVRVDPAPTLLMLFGDATGIELRQQIPGVKDDVVTSIPLTIGTPLQVLWDSVTDSIAVVGDLGVHILGSAATQTLVGPCGGTIRSATLQGGHLLLLVDLDGTQYAHCELDPTGATTTPLVLDNISTVTTGICLPSKIMGNPLADQLLIVGVDAGGYACAFEYRTASGLTVFQDASGQYGLPVASDLDPWGSFAATLINNDGSPYVVGWATGANLYASPSSWGFPTDSGTTAAAWGAVGIDLVSGETLYTVTEHDDNVGIDTAILGRLLGRTGDPRDRSLSSSRQFYPAPSTMPVYSAMAIDNANRRLYTMHDGALAPLMVVGLDDFGGFPDTEGAGISTLPIVDLAIAGPQPLAISTDALMPGAIVTVNGIGFQGGDLDEVYVQGLQAQTLTTTPTSVTFEVPPALARVPAGLDDAWVTVRSHGRMSGPVFGHARVPPPSEGRSIGMRADFRDLCGYSPGCTPSSPMHAGPSDYPLIHTTSSSDWLELWDPDAYTSINILSSSTAPPGGATFFGSRHYLGVFSDNDNTSPKQYWQVMNVPVSHSNYSGLHPETPRAAFPFAYDVPTATAVSPDDRTVATLIGADVHFFSSTTYDEVAPSIVSAAADPRGLVFAPDGNTLFIAATDGLEASTLSPTPVPPVPVTVVLGACTDAGAELGSLLTLSPDGPNGELTAVYSFPTSAPQAMLVASVHPDPTSGWLLECLAIWDFGFQAYVTAAAVSPTGDTVAVAVDEPSYGQDTVWVMRRADLYPWSNNLYRTDPQTLIDLRYSRDGRMLSVILDDSGYGAMLLQQMSDLPVDPTNGQGG